MSAAASGAAYGLLWALVLGTIWFDVVVTGFVTQRMHARLRRNVVLPVLLVVDALVATALLAAGWLFVGAYWFVTSPRRRGRRPAASLLTAADSDDGGSRIPVQHPTSETRRTTVMLPESMQAMEETPSVCVVTGAPTTARLTRNLAPTRWSPPMIWKIPVRADLLDLQRHRQRKANRTLAAFAAAWVAAILIAIPAANAPPSSPLGPLAVVLFMGGLLLSVAGILFLAQALSTIPVQLRVVVGDDGLVYLRIGNANSEFVRAVERSLGSPASTSAATHDATHDASTSHAPTTRTATNKVRIVVAAYVFWVAVLLLRATQADVVVGSMLSLMAAAAALTLALVAAATRWRIHIGSLLRITPLNVIVTVLLASLAATFGVIAELDPQHNSDMAQTSAGVGSAVFIVACCILFPVIWNGMQGLRPANSRPRVAQA